MAAIILYLSVLIIIPIMIWMLVNESRFKKNLVLGVTLPQEAHDDPQVNAELAKFRKNEIITGIALAALAAVCMVLSMNRLNMTLFMFYTLAIIAVPYIPYLLSRRVLLRIKKENGWVRERQTVMVNMNAMPDEHWLSPWLFLPAFILTVIPMFFDRESWYTYIIMAVLSLTFWFCYRYLYRNKAEAVDSNTEITIALSRIRKYNWGKMWLVTAYGMAGYTVCLWLSMYSPMIMIIGAVVITAVILWFAVRIEFSVRRLQEKLTENSGVNDYIDEDEHWLGGILYYNPDDSRVIINSRIGVNSSVNIATVPGKIVIALSAVLLLALPAMGMSMDQIGKAPILLSVTDDTASSNCGRKTYTIQTDDIMAVELLEKLPDNLQRRAGTGMDTYLEGSFYSPSTDYVTVMLDPTVSPYILITTDSKTYLFGSRDPEKTEMMYNLLKK